TGFRQNPVFTPKALFATFLLTMTSVIQMSFQIQAALAASSIRNDRLTGTLPGVPFLPIQFCPFLALKFLDPINQVSRKGRNMFPEPSGTSTPATALVIGKLRHCSDIACLVIGHSWPDLALAIPSWSLGFFFGLVPQLRSFWPSLSRIHT